METDEENSEMTLRRGGRLQTEGVTTGGYFAEVKARTVHITQSAVT